MKKIFSFFAAIIFALSVNAQSSIDLSLDGFVDEENNPISVLNLSMTDDFSPSVLLTNNGPDFTFGAGDTVFFDVSINGSLMFYLFIPGEAFGSNLTVGASTVVGSNSPILTAADLNELGATSFVYSYTVRITSATITDPVSTNNSASLTVNRGTGIESVADAIISIYPNPATDVINITNAEGSQIQLFDISGKMVYEIQNASANQVIDATSLSQGVYVARIRNNESIITKKIVVK